MTKIILLIYGLFLLAGSFFGWKAGSKVSLIAAILSSLFVFGGLITAEIDPVTGYLILTVVTALLCGTFGKRLLATKKFMPSGMLLLTSLVALALSARQWMAWSH